MVQAGIIDKLVDEVRWELQRSSSGGLMSVSIIFSTYSLRKKVLRYRYVTNFIAQDLYYRIITLFMALTNKDMIANRTLEMSYVKRYISFEFCLQVGKGSLKVGALEEKGLTLEDTQGMFLLLAAGFIMAVTSLLSEWMGGFTQRCRAIRKRNRENAEMNATVSEENIVTTPKSTGSEIKIIDSTESRLEEFTRSTSAGSKDTFEGQIINLTEENILVHNNLDTDDWDSRRSSSVDLDREIREIFEKDQSRRRKVDEDVVEVDDEDGVETALSGAFGDRLKSKI